MKCFIGLPAAPSVINKLVDAQDRALSFDAGARPVPKENFHLTLAFIGEIEPDKARLIAQLLPLTTDFNGKSWLIDNSGLFIRPQVGLGRRQRLSGDRTFGPRIARDFGSSPYLLRQRPF